MPYKLVCLDVDGTLLGSYHQLPQGNVKAIHALHQVPEVKVVLCSARPPRAMEDIYRELALQGPVICMNGSLILEGPIPFQKLSEWKVPPALLQEIEGMVQSLDVRLAYYDDSQFYALQPDPWIERESSITKVKVDYLALADMNRFWQEKGGPHKVQAIGPPSSIAQLMEKLKLGGFAEIKYTLSHETYLEIVHHQASKRNAVQLLQEQWGLSAEDILAMGDNFNDLDLLVYAGKGVAMANAPQAVREAADEVSLSNDQEGVRMTLEKYFPLEL